MGVLIGVLIGDLKGDLVGGVMGDLLNTTGDPPIWIVLVYLIGVLGDAAGDLIAFLGVLIHLIGVLEDDPNLLGVPEEECGPTLTGVGQADETSTLIGVLPEELSSSRHADVMTGFSPSYVSIRADLYRRFCPLGFFTATPRPSWTLDTEGGGQWDLNRSSEDRMSVSESPDPPNRSGDIEVATVSGLAVVVEPMWWVGLVKWWEEPSILEVGPDVKLLWSRDWMEEGEGSLLSRSKEEPLPRGKTEWWAGSLSRGRREGGGEEAEVEGGGVEEEGVELTCWEYGGVLNCGVIT